MDDLYGTIYQFLELIDKLNFIQAKRLMPLRRLVASANQIFKTI
jgi:hypothetical protein